MDTFRQWLEQLGLSRYTELFAQNDVDMEALRLLTESDLEKLGISLGNRKKLLNAIARLQPDPLIDASNKSPDPESGSAEAQRRQLTVLFCDLVGSTALADQLDPEELRELMQAYQQSSRDVIERYEGHIAQYLGDGLMVYFGWPRAHEDDAARAIRAGLEVAQAVSKLAVSPPIAARVGIHTGVVVVGQTGQGDASIPKAAVGDTPNIAARLQALAEPGSVVVSERSFALARGMFDYTELGPHALKGISEPIRLFRVMAARTIESRFDAARGEVPLTPLVGREEEIALLLRRWQQATEGEGQVVLVNGEPGIGKSRLTRVLSDYLGDERNIVLRYQCSPYHANSALYPIIDQFERAAGFMREETVEQKIQKMEAVLVGSEALIAEQAPLFAAMLSLPLQQYPPLGLSPQVQKERTLEALVSQLEALAQRQPVLVLFEDVHWIDATTQQALDLLVPRLRDLPVLLVVTHRPEYAQRWSDQAHVTQLSLIRLGRRQGVELARRITGDKALPQEVLEQILNHTDGVPLFIEELTKSVLESKLLHEENDRYTLQGPLPALAIPTTLRDSLLARLDRLAPVREVAQIGACIGREFPYELLALVCSLESARLDEAIEQLVKTGLIFRRGTVPNSTYTFKHALVQDAAYDSMLKGKRQELHVMIAQAIAHHFPEQAKAEPELLAHHCMEGRIFEKAIEYWKLAAQRAIARFATTEAIAFSRRGLQTLSKLTQGPQLAREEVALRMALIASLRMADRYDEALAELNVVESVAVQNKLIAELPHIHHSRGNIYFPLGKIDECLAEHEAALQFARQAKLTEDEARALGGIGDAYYMAGRMHSAHKHVELCLQLCRAHGFDEIATAYLPVRAATHFFGLRFEQAFEDCRSAIELATKCGQPRAEAVARIAGITILLDQHEFVQAEEHARRARELVEKIGARRFVPLCNQASALARLHRGDRTGALTILEESLAICRETGMRFCGPIVLGDILIASNDAQRRQEVLTEGEAILNGGCVSFNYFGFYRRAVDFGLGEASWERADAYATALEAYCQDEPLPLSDFIIARGRALAEFGRGNRTDSLSSRIQQLYEEAVRLRWKSELTLLTEALQWYGTSPGKPSTADGAEASR